MFHNERKTYRPRIFPIELSMIRNSLSVQGKKLCLNGIILTKPMQQLHYTFNNYINNRVYISNLKNIACTEKLIKCGLFTCHEYKILKICKLGQMFADVIFEERWKTVQNNVICSLLNVATWFCIVVMENRFYGSIVTFSCFTL